MKLYMFRTVPLSIIRSTHSLYTQQWYMSYRFVDSSRAGCSILILLRESCLQSCMTYTIAECTVSNSWWWTEELSEICRVLFPNKFEKLVHLVGFIIKNTSLLTSQITTHVIISHCITSHTSTTFQILICLRPPYFQFSRHDLPLSHRPILSTYSRYKNDKPNHQYMYN
jgi:hypothetical protein